MILKSLNPTYGVNEGKNALVQVVRLSYLADQREQNIARQNVANELREKRRQPDTPRRYRLKFWGDYLEDTINTFLFLLF